MFTALPFVVISLFFTLFGFLLTGALAALLTVYSASEAEYANSIRWSRQGGYLEMFRTATQSVRHVPRRATAAMVVMITASIVTMFASVGLSRMVHQTEIETNSGTVLSQTNQLLRRGGGVVPDGWTEYLGQSSAANEALKTMLVNPQYIVNMDSRKRYTPRTYDYEVACDKFDTAITRNISKALLDPIKGALYHADGGCSVIGFDLYNLLYNWTLANATYERVSEGRYKLVTGGAFLDSIQDLSPQAFFADSSWCTSTHDVQLYYMDIPRSGMTFPPSTLTFRCRQPSGEMQVAAATTFSFSVRHLDEFENVTSTIFDNTAALLLLDTMGTLVRNGTFSNLTINSTLVVLTDVTGAMVHYLGCHSRWVTRPNDLSLLCQYVVVDAFTTTPGLGDPIIAAAVGDRPSSVVQYTSNMIAMRHFASSTTSAGMAIFSVSEIINVTLASTRYMASLGPNFVMDDINQQLTILYDTTDIQSVSEMPTAVFWAMVVVMVACAGAMIFAMVKYDVRHKGSLYMVLHEKLKLRLGETEPALMRCTFEPLSLDGIPILQKGTDELEHKEP
ncbi:hypothetical protein BG003_010113 [Podila horticola]|nr:hypothetical protein BG003_010113 [Podila horticola]